MIKPELNMLPIPLALILILIWCNSPVSASMENPASTEGLEKLDSTRKYQNFTTAEKKTLAESFEVNGNHEDATLLYDLIIEEITRQQGPYHPDLPPLLLSLAENLLSLGHAKEAEQALRKGQHIIHRSQGVLSLEQTSFLDELTQSYLQMELPGQANRQQEFDLYINERHYGVNNLKLTPTLEKIAKWYIETGQYNNSRKILHRSVATIESQAGVQDLKLIEPLSMISKSQLLDSKARCCGEESLKRIVKIVENNSAATDEDRLNAYLQLADALIVKGQSRQADAYYRRAWNLASENSNHSDLFTKPAQLSMVVSSLDRSRFKRYKPPVGGESGFPQNPPLTSLTVTNLKQSGYTIAVLDIPPQEALVSDNDNNYDVLINESTSTSYEGEESVKLVGHPFRFFVRQLNQILSHGLKDPSKLANIEISVSFSVYADGSVRNVSLLESNAPAKLNRLVKLATLKSRFRPRIVEGNRAKTEQVKLKQTFKLSATPPATSEK